MTPERLGVWQHEHTPTAVGALSVLIVILNSFKVVVFVKKYGLKMLGLVQAQWFGCVCPN